MLRKHSIPLETSYADNFEKRLDGEKYGFSKKIMCLNLSNSRWYLLVVDH